ncbi:DUF2062 domain-containing protein [Fuscovulum ytuae]|uniref:DUF2062 domain-containing protein n=1 Tax=Fuscovulum ytuae TaxID=3042299 RepID=A0ABY8QA51_9RHOB|nr:DUF2062 domain-containing protein [Fuscovulum sp. YMD61]WGV17142.1 DUF2062 domain-containing protein [Fuscovulum sp. YMD61]
MRDWLKGLGRMRSSLEGNRTLRPVAEWLRAPSIWHVSRRSVARGAAIGLFSAFVLPVGQVFLAALIAIVTRGNVIVASLATLVTNPLVLPAIYVAAWRVGREILGPAEEIREVLEGEPVAADFLSGLSDASLYTAVGLLVFATVSAVIGYVLVHVVWWVTTRVKIRQRRRRAVQRRAARSEV